MRVGTSTLGYLVSFVPIVEPLCLDVAPIVGVHLTWVDRRYRHIFTRTGHEWMIARVAQLSVHFLTLCILATYHRPIPLHHVSSCEVNYVCTRVAKGCLEKKYPRDLILLRKIESPLCPWI
jgi:hypothetical protein